MMSREIEPRLSSYNDRFGTLEISPRERKIGAEIYDLFYSRLTRVHPWNIRNGVVTVSGTRETIDGLGNERISDELARVTTGFKMVEDFLPDYMTEGTMLTRNITGLSMFNIMWGGEEVQHGLVLGSILEQTGHKTRDQIKNEYQENLTRKIKLPYPTDRLVAAYSVFQENGTGWGYLRLRERALEEGALKTARKFTLIAGDEFYHGWGYKQIIDIYHDDDPEGTEQDILDVARNFRFPADRLHPKPVQWVRDLIRVGAYSKELVADKVVFDTLKGFGFIPKDLARKTADEFYQNRSPLTLASLRGRKS